MQPLIQEVQATAVALLGRTIEIVPGFLAGLFILIATRFIARTIRRIVSRVSRRTLANRSLRMLVIQVSFVLVWVAGVLFAAVVAFPGLELGNVVALLGLSSVAIGFAFQDIFKNFLAGILLLLQEPFSLGDQVIVDGYEGTVEGIALRSTQIRTYQGEKVVLPNSVVFTSPVQVLTATQKRRTDLAIGVDYNTPLQQAIQTLTEAAQKTEGVASDPEVEVDAVAFGASSIDLVVRYWTRPEKRQVRQTQTRVMLALKQACDRVDISIPYPIRSVYWYDQRGFDEASSRSSADAVASARSFDSNGQSSNGRA